MCLGVPGQVVAIEDPARKLGLVEVAGVRRVTNLACIIDDAHPVESCVGDWVLVHVGFAMSRIDADEARKTLALLREIGEVHDYERQLAAADAARGKAGPSGAATATREGGEP